MAINVLLTRKFFPSDVEYIKSQVKEGCNIIVPEVYTEDGLLPFAKDADIFFGPIISKTLCGVAKHLKFIQIPWNGVDNLDFDLIKEIGVKVCNSHSNAYCVAELAVSLMLDAAKKLSYHDRTMRKGDWNRPRLDASNTVSPFSSRVSDSNVGIIGYGHIGKLIREYLSGFGCKFHVADISVKEKRNDNMVSYYPMDQIESVLKVSDYLFLCVPLTEETRGFWNKQRFSQMKSDSILINTSRGEIIDEEALYNALKNRIIAGAAIDTWYNNPKNAFDTNCLPSTKFPFEELDNLVLSPHRAGMIVGELPHLEDAIVNINRTIDGLEPVNVVSVENKF